MTKMTHVQKPALRTSAVPARAAGGKDVLRRLLLCPALVLALAPALRAQEFIAAPTAAAGASAAVYRIAPGDVLEIAVLHQPDLSKTVTILPDGKVTYPYLGEMNVAGLTVSELTQHLTTGLEKQLVHPQVTVSVATRQEKQVSVLGAVKTPGKRAMKDGWRVLDIIADCGGLSVERPEWASATLVRGGGADAVPVNLVRLLTTADPQANLSVAAGDILLVQELDPSRTQVQVLGEVDKPGPVPVPKDGSVVSVLMAAGGPTPKAALSRATILRGDKTLPLDLGNLRTDGKVAEGVKLQAGDTLVVPQNKLQFAVFGAARNPGAQDYPEGETLTVVSALTRSGGQAPEADLKNATLVRPSRDGKPTLVAVNLEDMLKKGDLSKDVPVQPGDILYLPSKKQGGGFRIMDVIQYLPLVNLFYR